MDSQHPGAQPGGSYTFGDTEPAAARLELLSEIFAESTEAFLREVTVEPPRLAVDLGCGPGYSTVLVATALRPERTVGLDNSPQFLDMASALANDHISFALHDVAATPLPVPHPPDLLYARFLLMHLPDPWGTLHRWGEAIAPGGLVIVQESEEIHPYHDAFAAYLDIVEAMLLDNGNEIYMGPVLDAAGDTGPLTLTHSQTWRLKLPADVVARLYTLNLRSMRNQPFVQRFVPVTFLNDLERGLASLATTSDQIGIEWDVRGLVYERRP